MKKKIQPFSNIQPFPFNTPTGVLSFLAISDTAGREQSMEILQDGNLNAENIEYIRRYHLEVEAAPNANIQSTFVEWALRQGGGK